MGFGLFAIDRQNTWRRKFLPREGTDPAGFALSDTRKQRPYIRRRRRRGTEGIKAHLISARMDRSWLLLINFRLGFAFCWVYPGLCKINKLRGLRIYQSASLSFQREYFFGTISLERRIVLALS